MLLHNQEHTTAADAKALKAEAVNHICAINMEMKKAPGHVGQQIKTLAQLADKLLTLRKQLLTISVGTNTTNYKEKAMLEQYLRKKADEAISAISAAGAKAVSEAANCAWIAGRIDEFIYVFHQVNTGDSNGYCIKGASNAATKTEITCIDDNTGKPTPPAATEQQAPKPREKLKDFSTAAASIRQADTNDGKCGLTMHDSTDGGYTRGQTITPAIKWGGGVFTTGGGTNPSFHTSATGDFTDTELALCTARLETLTSQIAAPADTEELLKLARDAETTTFNKITIKPGALGANTPKSDFNIEASILKGVHADLRNFRTANNNEEKKINQHLNAVETALKLNATASNLECSVKTREAASTDKGTQTFDCKNKQGSGCTGDCVLEDGVCKPKKKGKEENKEKMGKQLQLVQ
uniref:Variant surface glycoprotein 1125.5003 n=1 Tax=Trypanosoma brucei TaxID=5691 RepID=A0A1J0RBJ3_9TRYP|nr:variant surface glycoprotein 1125.5003 [Trypanosoma brucei]